MLSNSLREKDQQDLRLVSGSGKCMLACWVNVCPPPLPPLYLDCPFSNVNLTDSDNLFAHASGGPSSRRFCPVTTGLQHRLISVGCLSALLPTPPRGGGGSLTLFEFGYQLRNYSLLFFFYEGQPLVLLSSNLQPPLFMDTQE